MAIYRTKNGGKQSFNAPFSASHLEKTRISASDFANQSRTNEKPPVVRRGNPKRIQNRQGFHCGNSKRMQNRRASSPCPPRHPSRTLPTNEWRKFIRFRNKWRKLAHYSAGSLPQTHADPPFVLKRKKTAGHSDRQDGGTHGDPPIIRSERQDECMQIRHSFSNEKNRQSPRNTQATPGRQLPAANSRRPTPDGPRENTRCGTGHRKTHEHLPAARHRAECRMHRRSEASQQMAGRSLSPPGASATRTPSPHGEAQDSK